MISKFFAAFAALALCAPAMASAETREAYLSAIGFDGKKAAYKYTAYDTTGPVKEDAKVSCHYTNYGGALAVRSVELKVMITADFSMPGAKVEREGSVDIEASIKRCQSKIPSANARREIYPVEVKLPAVSVPVTDLRN